MSHSFIPFSGGQCSGTFCWGLQLSAWFIGMASQHPLTPAYFLLSGWLCCRVLPRVTCSSRPQASVCSLPSWRLWIQFSSVQSLSRVRLFATPWITARQASLSINNSRSSLWLTSIESVMPSSHLILCRPLLHLPPIPPSIRVFCNESTLHMRWPKYWSFSFSIIPSKEHPGLISFRMDWLDLLAVPGTLKSLLQHHSSKASILPRSAFFTVQLSHPYMTTGKTTALSRLWIKWLYIKVQCYDGSQALDAEPTVGPFAVQSFSGAFVSWKLLGGWAWDEINACLLGEISDAGQASERGKEVWLAGCLQHCPCWISYRVAHANGCILLSFLSLESRRGWRRDQSLCFSEEMIVLSSPLPTSHRAIRVWQRIGCPRQWPLLWECSPRGRFWGNVEVWGPACGGCSGQEMETSQKCHMEETASLGMLSVFWSFLPSCWGPFRVTESLWFWGQINLPACSLILPCWNSSIGSWESCLRSCKNKMMKCNLVHCKLHESGHRVRNLCGIPLLHWQMDTQLMILLEVGWPPVDDQEVIHGWRGVGPLWVNSFQLFPSFFTWVIPF